MFVVENSLGTDFLDMSADGETTLSTLAGAAFIPLTLINDFDGADVTAFKIRGPNRVTPTNGDTTRFDVSMEGSGGFTEVVRHKYVISDVTGSSEDSQYHLLLKSAGILRNYLKINTDSNPKFYVNPDSQDIDFVYDSSTAANVFNIDGVENEVTVNGTTTGETFHIKGISDKVHLGIVGNSTQTSNMMTVHNSGGTLKYSMTQEGVINYAGTMGNGTQNPATDAPTDWVEIKIAGTTYYLPAYT